MTDLNIKLLVILRRFTIYCSKKKFLKKITSAMVRLFARSNKGIWIDDYNGNLFFYCRLDETISSSIFWRGYYSEAELKNLSLLFKDDSVFIDIGANKGAFTVYVAKQLSKGWVLSFEPERRNFDILKKNIDKNRFNNVEIFNKGVGNKHETIPIYGPSRKYLDGTRNEGAFSVYISEKVEDFLQNIEIDSLDNFLKDKALKKIDVVKIDVEGSEIDVLNGMFQTIMKYKPYIMIESNEKALKIAGHTASEIFSILNKVGYRYKPANDIKHEYLDESELSSHRDILCVPDRIYNL